MDRLKRNPPTAVVLSANDDQGLQRSADQPDPAGPSCLKWLLELPLMQEGCHALACLRSPP
ncbi:MAG: hypothetical protein ACK5N0_12695 [Synechococcaceae cyanobacterium]